MFKQLHPAIIIALYYNVSSRIITITVSLLVILSQGVDAQQKRMVAIGSSTTAGYITTSEDSSWFGHLRKYYGCQLGILDTCYNYGVPGTGVYVGMPSSYSPPAGRARPDTKSNITKAVEVLTTLTNPADGAIIVNYPSNDYNILTIPEIMKCLQVIYDSATRDGNRCFITTTQPRTDSLFRSSAMKKKLADIKDSTINRFGVEHTINFWDGMFNPADTTILPKYSAGDVIHFNNAGHRVLYERIVAKNIFGLPFWYAASTGALNLLTTWGSNVDGTGTHPVTFTANNQVFIVVNNLAPTINGNWTISGSNVQLIIGNGVRPVKFNIPPAYRLTITSPQPPSNCN
ncbi:MAG: SGNH/GDSL hydrolase family protein [Ferruginibacter sp.]